MAVLVHITNANNEKSISQSGIKQGKWDNIVYFMPHMEEFLISHQWARELKRRNWGQMKVFTIKLK